MIGNDAPELTSQTLDEIPEVKRPGGITVEHKESLALPFINVVQAVSAQLDES